MSDLALPPGIKPPLGVWPLDLQGSAYFSFIFFLRIFIYIVGCFLTAESSLAHGLSLVAVSEGCSLLAVHSLLIAVASLVAKGLGLSSRGSRTLEHGLSCFSSAYGVFLDQGLNLCLLHFAGRFFTTKPPGKPSFILFF